VKADTIPSVITGVYQRGREESFRGRLVDERGRRTTKKEVCNKIHDGNLKGDCGLT